MQAGQESPHSKARLARAFGLDGNPLRRASDRAEAWIQAGLLAIFLIAGPIAAVVAGQWTAHSAVPGTGAQPHAVRAILLQPATAPAGPARAVAGARVQARAQWESAGGSVRTGEVPALAAVVTAVMVLAVTALALLVVQRLIQCFLNWRRLAAWEAAWRATGPQWTGHRS
jgi:hypothetical protein